MRIWQELSRRLCSKRTIRSELFSFPAISTLSIRAGGDKSSQDADIKTAIKIAKEWKD